MAATQSPAPSSSSSSSFASRRPLARAALPPFTLPPPPEFPRPTAASASSTLSPPTPTPPAGAQQPSGSPYSTGSSPGYASSRVSSTTSTMLAHPQRATSHSPYESHPRPGPLSHPLHNNPIQLSPRKPLPGSSSGQLRTPPSRFTEKLPSIASLIPPPSQYGASPRSPNQDGPGPGPGPRPGPSSGFSAPGYLAMPPVKGPWGMGPPPAANPRYYHEFSVPEYPIARESSQQDRPFRCDLCTQCFSRNHDLKRHKRIHMAAKPFPCPTCNKSFSRRDALKVCSPAPLSVTNESSAYQHPTETPSCQGLLQEDRLAAARCRSVSHIILS